MERAAGRSVRQFEGLWKLRQIKVEGETLELLEVVEICVRDRWLDVLDGVAKGEEKTLDKRGVLVSHIRFWREGGILLLLLGIHTKDGMIDLG